MTKRGLFARCALGLVLATTAVSAADWNRYCNPRFGQCADIPAGFRADPPPANGDGLVFRDAYGASITISAGYNVMDDPMGWQRNFWLETIGSPAYQAHGPNWFVLSGVKGATIYYVKVFITPSTASTLAIEYPADRKAAYDGIVARTSKSFTASSAH